MLDTNVDYLYFPSCYRHTIIESSKWKNLHINNYYLQDIVFEWSLKFSHEKERWISDTCLTPDCNPSCKL
jgi:hypothetical protein